MEDRCLVNVFVKEPKKGKVKTRLAVGSNEDFALDVYNKLLVYTAKILTDTPFHTAIWFNPEPYENHPFENHGCYIQPFDDLGNKMEVAFNNGFLRGFNKVLIIGSDCPDVSSEHIAQAFELLNHSDVVFGPARDGGYYLLGMNTLQKSIFHDKPWSTESLLETTLSQLQKMKISWSLLEELTDIDTINDFQYVRNEAFCNLGANQVVG